MILAQTAGVDPVQLGAWVACLGIFAFLAKCATGISRDFGWIGTKDPGLLYAKRDEMAAADNSLLRRIEESERRAEQRDRDLGSDLQLVKADYSSLQKEIAAAIRDGMKPLSDDVHEMRGMVFKLMGKANGDK